jgi:hypothetical protein
MLRKSIPFPRINPLQPNRPLLCQPSLDPLLIRPFILQRNNRLDALPFAFPGGDAESALERGSDEELVDEPDTVALCYVVRGR